MIKYSPVRETMSESLKAEEIFQTINEMEDYVLAYCNKIAAFVGGKPVRFGELTITDASGDDICIGYKNIRSVFVGSLKIGFCGE